MDKFDDDKLCQLYNGKLFRPNMVDVNKVRDLEDDKEIVDYLFKIASDDIDARLAFLRDILDKAIPQEVKDQQPDVIEKNIQLGHDKLSKWLDDLNYISPFEDSKTNVKYLYGEGRYVAWKI